MEHEQVERINELARKLKTVGLTPEELKERDALRKQYIAEFRENMRAVLDNTYVQQPDGTKVPLQPKKKN